MISALDPLEEAEELPPLGIPAGKWNRDIAAKQGLELSRDGFTCLPISDPATFLAVFHPSVSEERITLWPWQVEVLEFLGNPGFKPTQNDPLKYCLVAANGSGKDSFIIAPASVWFILTRIQARVIITSASASQLESQTEPGIRLLAESVNKAIGHTILDVKKRHIRCTLTGSEIRLFATDEPGKAEGYHPLMPGAEMMIIVNEAKSITEDIFQAISRCTGYNYWLEVSSSGEPKGHLYNAFNHWEHKRRITAFECGHLGEKHRKDLARDYGENSAFYRRAIHSEFVSIDGEVVISLEVITKCIATKCGELDLGLKKRIGLDLGAGVNETVMTVINQNKIMRQKATCLVDTTQQADLIHEWLSMENGGPPTAGQRIEIYADDCGIGRGTIDQLVRKGWEIFRVRADGGAVLKTEFGNRGAELWFTVKRILEECLLDFSALSEEDLDKLKYQLSGRHYHKTKLGRIILKSKKEEEAEGFPSPDRADSLIIGLSGLTLDDFLKADKKNKVEESRVLMDERQLHQWMRGLHREEEAVIPREPIYGSTNVLLGIKDL